MSSVTSKRSGKFYLSIILYVLFYLVMALIIAVLSEQSPSLVGEVIMLLIVAALVFGAFYTVIRFYKNVPKITVSDESISFNNSTYYWKDLEKIEMTGKRPFGLMLDWKEGASLKFAGEKERYIFDDMYDNTSEIKSFIAAITNFDLHFDEAKDGKMIEKDQSLAASQEYNDTKYYKGNPLFSLTDIFLGLIGLFYISFCVLGFAHGEHIVSTIIAAIIIFLLLLIFARRMNYFELNNDSFVVSNYISFWRKDEYSLEGIREIVFEQKRKMPITLRIIDKDFHSKTYHASTLWGKTWMQLKSGLESNGIKVRNECVHYEPFEFKFFND